MESDSARMCEASIEKTGVSIPLVMNLEKMYDSRCMEQIPDQSCGYKWASNNLSIYGICSSRQIKSPIVLS